MKLDTYESTQKIDVPDDAEAVAIATLAGLGYPAANLFGYDLRSSVDANGGEYLEVVDRDGKVLSVHQIAEVVQRKNDGDFVKRYTDAMLDVITRRRYEAMEGLLENMAGALEAGKGALDNG